MLAAAFRLRRPRDINRVYKQGAYAGAGTLNIKYVTNNLEFSRVVVVVSRKISKKAVVRNRIRRRLSALLAEIWPELRPGYDIVVTVRQDNSQAPTPALKHELVGALKKGRLLNGKEVNV